MINLTTTDYTWFIIIGLLVGWVFHMVYTKSDVSIISNIIIGILSAIIGGLIFDLFDIGGAEIFAFTSALLSCFILNVYYSRSDKEVLNRKKHNLHIRKG